ncbi:unnamed protein product [Phytophthora fragariaefolia]|uniref:Unnamed protein product n=1 Tax=Phytophthora fragariaefolia TaxID=1490495 RepID=A0A9W6XQL2_9STRA|nr:unnamed protein product [Phytophthora fragariaefolia]
MSVASKGRGLDKLPANAIHNRWSTLAALDSKDELAIAADSLQKVVCMSKLRLPKRLPYEKDKMKVSASIEGIRDVVYVRLRRNERANKVVLPCAEKYCCAKAMLEALLEHLSNLSSAKFYDELSAWKETVEVGLRRSNRSSYCHDVASGPDTEEASVNDPDMFAMLDPADAIATANLMEDMEMANSECVTQDSSDSDVPRTQPTAVAIVPTSAKIKSEEVLTHEHVLSVANDNGDGDVVSKIPGRQADIVGLPIPKRRSNIRATSKQLRQTRLVPERLALHKYLSGLPVTLKDLVAWARNTPDIKFVLEIMDKYRVQLDDAYLRARTIVGGWEANRPAEYMHNFVILVDLMRSMQVAITTAKREQPRPDELDESVKKHGIVLDMVASIDPKLWKFSG